MENQTHFCADSYGLQSYMIQEGMLLQSCTFIIPAEIGTLQINEALSSQLLVASV